MSKQRNSPKRTESPQCQTLTETERKRRLAQLGMVMLRIVDKMDRAGRPNGNGDGSAKK